MSAMTTGVRSRLGSARVPRAGDGVPAIADFYFLPPEGVENRLERRKVRGDETPPPARETRALPDLCDHAD